MTRKKVKLAYITNDSSRKATFKKRKKGLLKKVSELSTLCGIDACAIIYSPYDSQPEVWPSPLGVQRVLSQFKNMPEMEQSKKMVNQDSFLKQRITKANDHLKKQRKDNREKEVTQVMFQGLIGRTALTNLNMMDLNDLGWLIDQNLKELYKKIEKDNEDLQANNINSLVAPPPPLPPTPPPPSTGEVAPPIVESQNFEVMNNMDAMQRQQWMMDWINPQENMGFGGDNDMMFPFGDSNIHNNGLWSSAFFP